MVRSTEVTATGGANIRVAWSAAMIVECAVQTAFNRSALCSGCSNVEPGTRINRVSHNDDSPLHYC